MNVNEKNMERKLRIVLIFPCFNEGKTIYSLLSEIKNLNKNYDTIVIDDCSRDNTYTEAVKLSPCIRLVKNLGIGGAVHTGIKYASLKDYDFCVQIDGDGQHPPDQVEYLLEAYYKSNANIVIGSRYIKNDTFRSTLLRRFGSKIISHVIKMLFKIKVTDPTSGMRLFDKKAIFFFSDAYPHDYPEPISLSRALNNKLTVKEIPVKMLDRKHGKSSINGFSTLIYMIRVVIYICFSLFFKDNRLEFKR